MVMVGKLTVNESVLFQDPSLALEIKVAGQSHDIALRVNRLLQLTIPDKVVLNISRRHVWVVLEVQLFGTCESFGL